MLLYMELSKNTRKGLIALCKEQKITGYSGKNKDTLIELLTNPHSNTIVEAAIEKNSSPLRYPGGKSRAINILYSYVCEYFPNKTVLLSPFFGGGSFELFLTTKGYHRVHANDLFAPLYTFWVTKQSDCQRLVIAIRENMAISKEKFQQMRNSIMEETDPQKVAASYFIINRCSFSGATLSGGYSEQAAKGRFTESSIQKLVACNVDSVHFTNTDCNVFLENNPETSETLVYADPPYYIRDYIYGKNGDMHESFDHAKFAETIQKRNDWIISYNNCEYIRELYKNCRIFEVEWSYGMNATKSSSEILILPAVS
jgi:DNA adenine methylase